MGNQKKLITKNFNVEVSNVNVESRIISGYCSSFNSIDSDGDLIVKGAFAKTLMENGVDSLNPRIFHLYQHDITKVLGRPTVLKEDDRGLYFETKIANTSLGDDVLNLYKENIINEHSIGFQTIKSANRGSYNEIQEVKLYEFSTVTFGANANTPFLGFKSQFDNEESITEQFEKVSKMLKGDITPETSQLLNIYLNQIKTAFLELSTKSVEAIDPLEDSHEDIHPIDEPEIEVKNNDLELEAKQLELIKAFMQGFKTA